MTICTTTPDSLTDVVGTLVDYAGMNGYGDPLEMWGRAHWRGRHAARGHRTHAKVCALSEYGVERFRCQCVSGAGQCCEHANQDDMRCEPCRRWCGTVDVGGGR